MESIWEEVLTASNPEPHSKAAVACFLQHRWRLLLLLRPYLACESDTLAFAAGGMGCYLIDKEGDRKGGGGSSGGGGKLWGFLKSSNSSSSSGGGDGAAEWEGDFFKVSICLQEELGFRV